MPTCRFCNRTISHAKRVYEGGVHHECILPDDVIKCDACVQQKQDDLMRANQEKREADLKFLYESGERGLEKIDCVCGLNFYTSYPLETMPRQDRCSSCGRGYCQGSGTTFAQENAK